MPFIEGWYVAEELDQPSGAPAAGVRAHRAGAVLRKSLGPSEPETPIRVEHHAGPRAELRSLFELAEDSPTELDSYQRVGFRMRSIERDAFTTATGYEPGVLVDGVELRDRVWLDLALDAAS